MWASMMRFEPRVWDLSLEVGIWALRLGYKFRRGWTEKEKKTFRWKPTSSAPLEPLPKKDANHAQTLERQYQTVRNTEKRKRNGKEREGERGRGRGRERTKERESVTTNLVLVVFSAAGFDQVNVSFASSCKIIISLPTSFFRSSSSVRAAASVTFHALCSNSCSPDAAASLTLYASISSLLMLQHQPWDNLIFHLNITWNFPLIVFVLHITFFLTELSNFISGRQFVNHFLHIQCNHTVVPLLLMDKYRLIIFKICFYCFACHI